MATLNTVPRRHLNNRAPMLLFLATLCYVTAAPTTTKFEARPRQFGSGLVVGLKRASNTANQSSLSGAWGNVSAPWPTPCFPAPAVIAHSDRDPNLLTPVLTLVLTLVLTQP